MGNAVTGYSFRKMPGLVSATATKAANSRAQTQQEMSSLSPLYPEGLNEIKVSLPGYEVWTKKVQCREGLEFTAHLTEAWDRKIKVSSDGG